ncbi:hypothetical protein N7456_010901 [Penicillium angulare]|uniref:Uncharacterized protein n=1 Tax=Penicillium angulare TaxID=116970 RepID=A0A9W9JZJ7_9EURO|nr:hypothetical protein N7456_010901 [Penicillium angulare]
MGPDPLPEKTTSDRKKTARYDIDEKGNPILNMSGLDLDKRMLDAEPLCDVDWRPTSVKDCSKRDKARAAYVQQAGKKAPPNEECTRCKNGLGPFSSCKVLIVDGEVFFGGSCGGCSFADAMRCSNRNRQFILAEWIKDELRLQKSNNPRLLSTNPQSDQSPTSKQKREISDSPNNGPDTNESPQDQKKAKTDSDLKPNIHSYDKWFRSPLKDPDVFRSSYDLTIPRMAYHALEDIVVQATDDRKKLEAWIAKKTFERPGSCNEDENYNPFDEEN